MEQFETWYEEKYGKSLAGQTEVFQKAIKDVARDAYNQGFDNGINYEQEENY